MNENWKNFFEEWDERRRQRDEEMAAEMPEGEEMPEKVAAFMAALDRQEEVLRRLAEEMANLQEQAENDPDWETRQIKDEEARQLFGLLDEAFAQRIDVLTDAYLDSGGDPEELIEMGDIDEEPPETPRAPR